MAQTETLVEAMAKAIVGIREFCGNELEAAKEACILSGTIFNPEMKEYFEATQQANRIWRGYQQEAGVDRKYWR